MKKDIENKVIKVEINNSERESKALALLGLENQEGRVFAFEKGVDAYIVDVTEYEKDKKSYKYYKSQTTKLREELRLKEEEEQKEERTEGKQEIQLLRNQLAGKKEEIETVVSAAKDKAEQDRKIIDGLREQVEELKLRTGLKGAKVDTDTIAKNKRVMELETQVEAQKVEIKGLKEQIEKATTEISNLRNMPAKVVEIEIEPADYQEAKERVQSLEGSVRTLKEENEGLTSKVSELESDLALAEQVKEDALARVKELMEKTSITTTTSASTPQEHTDEEYDELEKKYDEVVKDKENLEYDVTLLKEKLDKAKESGTQQAPEQPRVKKMNRVQVSKADDLFGGVNYQAKYEEEHKLREKAEKEVKEWNEWYKGSLQKHGSNEEDDENKGRRYATGYVNGANFVAEAYGITLREDLKQMISANSRKKG